MEQRSYSSPRVVGAPNPNPFKDSASPCCLADNLELTLPAGRYNSRQYTRLRCSALFYAALRCSALLCAALLEWELLSAAGYGLGQGSWVILSLPSSRPPQYGSCLNSHPVLLFPPLPSLPGASALLPTASLTPENTSVRGRTLGCEPAV